MRVTTELWVSALIRRVFSGGGYAAVLRKGAAEAGAVFLAERSRTGDIVLYGPAPQTSYDEVGPSERQFARIEGVADEAAMDARLAREQRFDPDIWVVETEPGSVGLAELIAVTTP